MRDNPQSGPSNPTRRTFLLTTGSTAAATIVAAWIMSSREQVTALYCTLNDVHFEAFLKHFRASLNEVGVKDDKAERVMNLLEAKRSAVLNRLSDPARVHAERTGRSVTKRWNVQS